MNKLLTICFYLNLLGQGTIVHCSISLDGPEQFSPPCIASIMIALSLVLPPRPQVRLQLDHSDHSRQTQSTIDGNVSLVGD